MQDNSWLGIKLRTSFNISCMYANTHKCMYVYIYIYIYMCVCVCVYLCMIIAGWALNYAHPSIYPICVHVHVYMCVRQRG
jgi:hypothetical protein